MDEMRLREAVCAANRELVTAGLVTLSFGNASGADRGSGTFLIKPSGVPYASLRPEDMVAVSIADGRVVAGSGRPSSDTPTHAALYRRFGAVGGIVHTHSVWATSWAQAGREIPCFGTTHADHFPGAVPVTRALTPAEIDGDYEAETGAVIIETFERSGIDPLHLPGVLVRSHGPFTWGLDVRVAVDNAIALEAVAAMAHHALAIQPDLRPVDEVLLRKHFRRKHGPDAYYGQPGQRR